ncbi:MAG: hypothetical protein IAE77_00650, partial [Prosthecobacter sp.]|uniref:hypothetical protein n=1 Tax=Prosthecobacter sp. TaxID=1965333 RepID=UPI0019E21C5F
MCIRDSLLILPAVLGLFLSACDSPGTSTYPAYYNPGCYVDLYEGDGFGGRVTQVMGPSSFSSLKSLNGGEWDNRISSIKTGPLCWLVIYKDESFGDASRVIPPATMIGDLGGMEDEIESIRVMDRAP